MQVKLVTVDDAVQLSKFYNENGEHLRAWEPRRESGYHSLEAWEERLREWCSKQEGNDSAHFVLSTTNDVEIIAVCSLTNIVKGPFMACHMGYAVARKHEGKGFMKLLCQEVVDYAFAELSLNRVMANYMPSNHRSARLLESLGFTKEGVARRYLKINGCWEDHILTSLLSPRNS